MREVFQCGRCEGRSGFLTAPSGLSRRARHRSAPRGLAFTALVLLLTTVAPRLARGEASREYDLKAVLLYHFTQFVDWPDTAFASPDAPLVIGLLGRDPFGNVLDTLVAKETRGNRRIVVERIRHVEAAAHCQILFINVGDSRELPPIFNFLRGRPILTVGDVEDFAVRGGMIRFMKNPEEKITVRVNLDAAKAGGLTISARLLHVAEIVTTTKK
jgi:hypothetical protein